MKSTGKLHSDLYAGGDMSRDAFAHYAKDLHIAHTDMREGRP
jgi:hypothetical protein